MKVIKDFNIWERTTLLTVIGNLPGGKMSEIVKASRILKVLSLTDDERTRSGFAITENGVKWEENFQSEIEFLPEDWTWLLAKVAEFDNWPFSSAVQLAELATKLE